MKCTKKPENSKLISDYKCLKCGHNDYEIDIITTSSKCCFKRFFNISRNKFESISCVKCGYTEIYKISR